MAIDKNYCMISYMAFRYIEKDDMDFYLGMHHKNIIPIPDNDKVSVHTADDIDAAIEKQIEKFANVKKRYTVIRRNGFCNRCLVHSGGRLYVPIP